jgi:hypothetical protein
MNILNYQQYTFLFLSVFCRHKHEVRFVFYNMNLLKPIFFSVVNQLTKI